MKFPLPMHSSTYSAILGALRGLVCVRSGTRTQVILILWLLQLAVSSSSALSDFVRGQQSQ